MYLIKIKKIDFGIEDEAPFESRGSQVEAPSVYEIC